ncbi:MAG: hypothetical protein HYY46_13815 [Deltaproteobacteria bacterium]|nr:hypothetical protein [Deltaproteobacteria bacterium]
MRKLSFVVSLGVVLLIVLFASFARNASAQTPQGPALSDHALFGPGDTAIYCGVATIGNQGEPYTLHVSATPAFAGATDANRTVTITFGDGDSITFRIGPNTSFSTTQELGGVPGVDDVVKITPGAGISSAMASVKVRAGAKDPFSDDGELDNFCLTKPGDDGSLPATHVFSPI